MEHRSTPAKPAPESTGSSAVRGDNRMREAALCLAFGVLLSAPVLGIGMSLVRASSLATAAEQLQAAASVGAHDRLTSSPANSPVAMETASRGRDVFASTCAACHGVKGDGGTGKNLADSDFVASTNDWSLLQFLTLGRTQGVPTPMPPRGGRADLTDGDLADVVSYLRGLQDPRRMPALAPPVAAAPSESDKANALAAAGGDAELAGYIASGMKLYSMTCVACHGPGGAGIKGNGKALTHNEFVGSQDDDSLLAFVKRGRAPSDPKNTTGVQMPPKGGNPALSDDDLLDVIAYLRTLQPGNTAAKNVGK